MPPLQKDASARGMHAIDDFAPTGDLFGRMNAGGVGITHTFGRDLRCFGDDQSGRCALRVILYVHRLRDITRRRAIARKRCHRDTVQKFHRADAYGREDVDCAGLVRFA